MEIYHDLEAVSADEPGKEINPSDWNDAHFIVGGPRTGNVLMLHDDTASGWTVYLPDGSVLDVVGTTSQGLQEAINYAAQNAYPLIVYGGGITPPAHGSSARSRIVISQPIAVPTGWGNSYYFYDVDLWWDGSSGVDFITLDSMDYTTFYHRGQIVYDGNQSAVFFKPTTDNGESFVGITSSDIRFGSIAVVSPITHGPENSHGIGIRFAPVQNVALSPSNGNGVIVNSQFHVNEINGGLVGIQIDDPAGTGKFILNQLNSPAIHGQQTGITIGGSAAAAGKIFGNIMDLIIAGVTNNAFITWAQQDIYRLSIGGTSAVGILLQASSSKNHFTVAHNASTTKLTDSSTAKDDIIPGAAARSYVPAWTGFSANPTGGVAEFIRFGSLVWVHVGGWTAGTSNATTFTVTLPFPARGNIIAAGPIAAFDNGAALAPAGRLDVAAGSNVASLFTSMAAGAWTATGGKKADFSILYEAQ